MINLAHFDNARAVRALYIGILALFIMIKYIFIRSQCLSTKLWAYALFFITFMHHKLFYIHGLVFLLATKGLAQQLNFLKHRILFSVQISRLSIRLAAWAIKFTFLIIPSIFT